MQASSSSEQGTPVGLLAGWGRYPLVVAQALRRQGHRVVGIGVKDYADPKLREYCDEYAEYGIGKLGAGCRFFQRHQVARATMAGKIHKVDLFEPFFILRHLPDIQGLRTFFPHFLGHTKDRKDDTLLGALVDFFARQGIEFAPATDFVPELLVKTGLLTRRSPTRLERSDIAFGWHIAKEMGRLDVGQTVAVKGRAVLAIEAVEGTDQCIRRAGQLCRAGHFTIVKVAKPQQDMRFDVPAVGVGTLESIVAAGGRVLAIEAGQTILVDREQVIDLADRHGITIVALHDGACREISDAA